MDDVLLSKTATVERCVARIRETVEADAGLATLADASALADDLAAALMRIAGFRNVAVHEYRALNLTVVRAVAVGGLGNVEAFARWMTARA